MIEEEVYMETTRNHVTFDEDAVNSLHILNSGVPYPPFGLFKSLGRGADLLFRDPPQPWLGAEEG